MRALLLSIVLAAQAMPPGISRTAVLDNASVMVARLQFAPGAREQVHTHPFSAVVVQLGPGEVETHLGTNVQTARHDRGHVDFIAAEMPHAAANVGATAFEVVTVVLKAGRTRGGDQPPTAPRPGISRAQLLDNGEARVARAAFDPGAREPIHSHPFDMVLVQLAPGRMELTIGSEKSVQVYPAGEVIFLPRDVPHSVANVDTKAFEIVSVSIK